MRLRRPVDLNSHINESVTCGNRPCKNLAVLDAVARDSLRSVRVTLACLS